MLALCYDEGKINMLREGSQIMIRNYIYRDNTIIITTQTKLARTSAMGYIPAGFMTTAKSLIDEIESQTRTISAAKTEGIGQTVSIVAKEFKEEATAQKTLAKTQEKVDVKSITLKDDSGEIKLSLWRQYAGVRNTPVRNVDVIVDGYYTEEEHIILVCNIPGTDDYKDYSIREDLMSPTVGDGEQVDTVLPPLLPLAVTIAVKENDSDILSINIC
ncbi:unnamed protein product [Mytilus coruscus]|uniref:Uncharacterized protein n=1 Tax=Mytilus coruscus TaxID=42192 RepID=A0A6J8CEM1_MYTCO|nr:unnamed protein product [Mytilus coruscus]